MSKQLTHILCKDEEPLCSYVINNIDGYLTDLINYEKKFGDDESTVIFVLNHKSISLTNKVDYVKKLDTVINDLADISVQNLYGLLLLRNLNCTLKNIQHYLKYKEYSIDNCLIEFVNNHNDYNFENESFKFEKEEEVEIFKCIAKENLLDIAPYKILLSKINSRFEEFDVENLDKNKVDYLINSNKIEMTEGNLDFIRANYSELLVNFAISSFEEYVSIMESTCTIDLAELMPLLKKDTIDENLKIKLIALYHEPISIEKLNYSDNIINYILRNNYNVEDLKYLLDNYFIFSLSTQDVINTIIEDNINEINQFEVPYNLLAAILKQNNLSIDDRLKCFIFNMKKLKKDDFLHCIEILKLNQFIKAITTSKNPKVDGSDLNLQIAQYIKKEKWISSYNEKSNNIQLFSKRTH